jgi:hypothetical protein
MRNTMGVSLAVACLAAAGGGCVDPGDGLGAFSANDERAGTSISAYKLATGVREWVVEYDWTLRKEASPTALTVPPGGSGSVTYTLTATRYEASRTEFVGVRGSICVENDGARATEGLTIVDQVEYQPGRGGWQDLPGVTQTITPADQLQPGESHCYPYEIAFAPAAGAHYRNRAAITITNHSSSIGTPRGPTVRAGFDLPDTYETVYVDDGADLSDAPSCPAGFTCTDSASGPWALGAPGTVSFTRRVDADAALLCDHTYQLPNTATLVERGPAPPGGETHTASADVTLYTGPCAQGCTPGYWKNHPDSWQSYAPTDTVASVFPAAGAYGLGDATLRDALAFRGGPGGTGAAEILLRAAVSALLNASHSGVSYAYDAGWLIAQVQAALGAGSRAAMIDLASRLDLANNAPCPLN